MYMNYNLFKKENSQSVNEIRFKCFLKNKPVIISNEKVYLFNFILEALHIFKSFK